MSTLYGMQGFATLTSSANPLIKDVRKAAHRGTLTSDGLCLAEGFHLLEEALRSGCELPVVLASATVAEKITLGDRVVVVEDRLFQTLATTENSQGVIALVRLPEWGIADVFGPNSLVVILDAIQDPGNCGAIMRAAEAFGATGILMTQGTVKPFNPKTLRASMGSVFRMPLVTGIDVGDVADIARSRGVALFAATPWTGREQLLSATDFRHPCAIVIGNEANGTSVPATRVAIPTEGVESLNAAIAASILLYEVRRQRS